MFTNLTNPEYQVSLEQTICCVCGVVFAIPERLLRRYREDGNTFYCPNGHNLWYGKSKAEKLQEELDATRKRAAEDLAAQQKRTREALARANEATARAVKAEDQTAKQKKRAMAGVCPCCKRTFANVARHIASKHKEVK